MIIQTYSLFSDSLDAAYCQQAAGSEAWTLLTHDTCRRCTQV